MTASRKKWLLGVTVLATVACVATPLAVFAQRRAIARECDELSRRALKAMDAQEYAEAERCFARVVELDPRDARSWLRLGRARWLRGDVARAREDVERSLALDPRLSMSHVLRAVCSSPDALEDLSTAIALEPCDGSAHAVRAVVHARAGRTDAAVEDLAKVFERSRSLFYPLVHRSMYFRLSRADLPGIVGSWAVDPQRAELLVREAIERPERWLP